jgi:uncharacterized phage protein gp47/JayE
MIEMEDDQIQREIQAYQAMRAELEAHHMGKHVIIKDGKLQGAYDSFDAAAREALTKFGRERFLIRQVGAADEVRLPASVAFFPVHAPR